MSKLDNIFGNEAIKTDEFKYVNRQKYYMKRDEIRTEEELIKEIRYLARVNKKMLNYSRLRKIGRYDLIYDAVKLFGGWRNVCINSGIKPLTKLWSKEEVVNEIRNYAKTLGRTPTRIELEKLNRYDLVRAAERRFGSWNSAILACNLTVNKRIWPKKLVISEMKDIVKKIGHTPSMNELRKLGRHDLLNALFKFFPSYNAFLLYLGLPLVLKMNRWYKKTVIKEIKKLRKKFGRTPTRSEIEEMGQLDLKMATLRCFGSWNKAIIAAGLNPNLDAIKNDFGKRWERFIIKIIKRKFKRNLELHKRLENKTIPDVFFTKEKKILEIKSNASDTSVYESIKNYSNFCNKLEFWYLYGVPPKIKNKKIIFRGSDYVEKILLKLNNKKLLKEFYELKKEVTKFQKT